MKTTGGSARRRGSRSACSRRNMDMRQENRIASWSSPSGIASAPSMGPTEPSKSRMSVLNMSGVPVAIRLEQRLERSQNGSHEGIADIDGVQRKREACAEMTLDLGISPAGDVVTKSPLQRVG